MSAAAPLLVTVKKVNVLPVVSVGVQDLGRNGIVPVELLSAAGLANHSAGSWGAGRWLGEQARCVTLCGHAGTRAGQRREYYFLLNRLGQSLHRRDMYRESERVKVPHWHIFLNSLWTTHRKSAQLSFFIPNELFFMLLAAGFRVLPQRPPRGSARGNKPVVVCWFSFSIRTNLCNKPAFLTSLAMMA